LVVASLSRKEDPVFSVALLMTLTTGANAPAYHPCSSYGGSYGVASYGGCYTHGASYGHGGCYTYGASYGHGGCHTHGVSSYGHGGCHTYGASYGHGGCHTYGGYAASYPTSCYSHGVSYPVGGYGYGGCYTSGYSYSSTSYGRAPDETQEEFDFCQDKAKDMSTETYSNFRNNVWLRMTHSERQKMIEKEKPRGKKGKKGGSEDDEVSSTPLPAQIVVTLPADARLTIGDEGTKAGGTRRVFVSPPLRPDRSYTYTLKALLVRDGKTVSVTKDVAVSAGKESSVSFNDVPQQDVASR